MSQERSQLIQLARGYQSASRIEKGVILEHLQAQTGWSRDHCRRSLREAANPKTRTAPGRPSGSRKYSTSTTTALEQLWHLVGQPSGRRLQAMMPQLLYRLDRHGELRGELADNTVRSELLTMSSASIDRYLRAARANSTPQSQPEINDSLQQRLAENEPVKEAGMFRLCAAAGNNPESGCSHILSLGLYDKLTGWRIRVATTSASPHLLFPLLDRALEANPVPFRNIHVHSGSELLNFSLISWAQQLGVDVSPPNFATTNAAATRDSAQCNCHPYELAMYKREAQLQTQLWEVLDARHNYLLPITRAKYKVWTGNGSVRVFDNPLTPLERLEVSDNSVLSDGLRSRDELINPAAIAREVARLQAELALARAQHAPAA